MDKKKFERIIVIAPTRSTCLNISMAIDNGHIPETLLMWEKGEELLKAVDNLDKGGIGVVAGTGTGKTVSIRDIAMRILQEDLRVDIVNREVEATDYTWTCNVIVITPGVAMHWLGSGTISRNDLIIIDEIHQTSEHLELSMALAKRSDCTFIWQTATVDPRVYAAYLKTETVIKCSAFDPAKKSKVKLVMPAAREPGERKPPPEPETFLESKVDDFISQKRAVAVFVPTRIMAENLAEKFGKRSGLYCDFFHGGAEVIKIKQFLKGDAPKPFMIFMTIVGSSSLNILGLDTVVIHDSMFKSVVRSGVRVLQNVRLGNNELLQMGGRVNGRQENSEIYIVTTRDIDFHNLKPTTPEFVLGGDLEQVALICAKQGVNAGELDLIEAIDHHHYNKTVERFRARGIIEKDSDTLTEYGEKVQELPVEPSWAELLVHARSISDDLLDITVVCSCVESLYSICRGEAMLANFGISGSDHLTSYNIIVEALNQFAYIRKSRDGIGLEYGFRGDWIKRDREKTEKGEFVEWCDKHNFNAKTIKEAAVALKSVYYQLDIKLPDPEKLEKVEKDSRLHYEFLELLARVHSLDFVYNESSSKAKSEWMTVWTAQQSLTMTNRILGRIRHWTDKKKAVRATIEGTDIPEDLVKRYAEKKPMSVINIIDEGVEVMCEMRFAEERIETAEAIIAESEIPDDLIESAQEKFLDAMMADRLVKLNEITSHNNKVLAMLRALSARSGGKIYVTREDVREKYEQAIKGKRIFSPVTLNRAIIEKQIDKRKIMLEVEDFVSGRKLKKIERNFPTEVMVDGVNFQMEYSYHEASVSTYITEEFARSTAIKEVIHPNGQAVKLICDHHSAVSFPELVQKIDKYRVEMKIREVKSRCEKTCSHPEEVYPHLPNLLKPVELSDESGQRKIIGYLVLDFDNYDFLIRIVDNQGEAKELTTNGLDDLVRKATESDTKIPDRAPFYNSQSWRHEMTDIGLKLQSRLNGIRIENSEGLTLENVFERIEKIKTESQRIKDEIAENEHLFSAGISELTFDALIKNKRVKELSFILAEVRDTLKYPEATIVQHVFALTEENGLAKRGNKLWMALRDKFPGSEFEVSAENLAMAIMERVE